MSHPSSQRRWVVLVLAGLLGTVPAIRAASAVRFRQIKVELAWMSDPVTFRCPLGVQAVNAQLRATGIVPSEAAKARALHLARHALNGPIVDGIETRAIPTESYSSAPSEVVTNQVKQVLAEVLGPKSAQSVEVATDGEGRVLLYSSNASLENKHVIAARLRAIRGCSCVVYATSRAMVRESSPQATTAGPVLASPMPAAPGDNAKAKPQPKPLPAPVTAPARPLPSIKPPVMPKAATFSPYHIRRVSAQLPEEKVIANTGKKAPPPSIATSTPPKPSPPPPGFNPVAEPMTAGQKTGKELTTPPMVAQPLVSKPLPSGPPTIAPKTPIAATTRQTTTAVPVPPPVNNSKPSRGFFSLFRKETPAAKPAPTPMPAAKPTPGKPYVTTGTVIFHDSPPQSATTPVPNPIPATATGPISPDVLRRKVIGAAGGMVKDVQIKPHSMKGWQVTIKLVENAQLEPLMNRLFQIPEITAPDVHISFELAP